MPTAGSLQAQKAYGEVMREVSQRIFWVERMLKGETGMNQMLVRDSCYLQVRMICELVALGCLIVHQDIPATQAPKLQKTWSAAAILSALERLHPDFFPHAHHLEPRGPGQWHFANREGGLNRHTFVDLYGRCGDALHRGTNLKLRKEGGAGNLDLSEVQEAVEGLRALLEVHSIALVAARTRIVGEMTPSLEGTYRVLIGEAL